MPEILVEEGTDFCRKNDLENFPFGHDQAQPLYDHELAEAVANDATVSLLFGGIGDARNLFATITEIAESELEKPTERSYHITINDIKATALARDIVIFFLLDELVSLGANLKEALVVFHTLCFVFAAPVMSGLAYYHLRKTIQKAITAIDSNSLPPWISLQDGSASQIVGILREWLDNAATLFPTGHVVDEVVRGANISPQWGKAKDSHSEAYKVEKECFSQTAMMFPMDGFMKAENPKLFEMVEDYRKRKDPRTLTQIRERVAEEWHPNLTALDCQWLTSGDHLYNIQPEPWQAGLNLLFDSSASGSFFDHIRQFFHMTVAGLSHIRDRLKVEIVVGDILQALEESRISGQTFDRIHLSNIPYVIRLSCFS